MGITGLEKYLERILEQIHEGIAVIDADGRYSFMNPAGEHILGKNQDEIIGHHYREPIWGLVNPDGSEIDSAEMPIFRVIETAETVRGAEYALKRDDGTRAMVLIDAEPFREETGTLMGALISFSDVTAVRRVQHLSTSLNEINDRIITSRDTDTVMQEALDMAVAALGCESGVIYRQNGADWVMGYLSGLPDSMLGTKILEASASFTVLTAGPVGSIAYNDAYHDDRIDNQLMRKYNIKSLLDVVLRVHERLVGDVSFHFHSQAVPFSQEDIDFANKFGTSVGLALENAKFYQEEQHVMKSLHSALLKVPNKLEGIEFGHAYLSGGQLEAVGGDFFDLFECDAGIGLVLGDVSGKGVEAASVAAEAKNAMKALIYDGESPAEAASKTNRMLTGSTAPNIFVTAILAILNTDSGTLTYCCAGHPPALIQRADSRVEILKTGSPLIGAVSSVDYFNEESYLRRGDRLLCYTDGVIEARRHDELYGEDRLVDTVTKSALGSPASLVDDVLCDVQEFTNNQLSDDVAIIAVALAQEDEAT